MVIFKEVTHVTSQKELPIWRITQRWDSVDWLSSVSYLGASMFHQTDSWASELVYMQPSSPSYILLSLHLFTFCARSCVLFCGLQISKRRKLLDSILSAIFEVAGNKAAPPAGCYLGLTCDSVSSGRAPSSRNNRKPFSFRGDSWELSLIFLAGTLL